MPHGSAVGPFSQRQRLGQDARRAGLADAARAGEQEGVVDAVLGDGVRQRARDVLLADQLREALRPVLARQDQVRHRAQTTSRRRSVVPARGCAADLDGPTETNRAWPACPAVAVLRGSGRDATRQADHQGSRGAARGPGLAQTRANQELTPEHVLAGAARPEGRHHGRAPAQARGRPGAVRADRRSSAR